MNKVGRTLSAAVVALGVAVAATGCADNVIGADGPRPGIAATVEGVDITLDDLTAVTDGLCTLQAADPQAPATSREFARTSILEAWVRSLLAAEFADEEGLEVSAPDAGLELAPGWDDVEEDDQDPLRAYVDAFVFAAAVEQLLAGEGGPDPDDYDIAINPRFDAELGADGTFEAAGAQLSVPVSDEAAGEVEAPTAEDLEALPEDEICGQRPDPQSQAPVPVG